MAGPGWIGIIVQYKWVIIGGVIVIVGIILWRRTKKKR